MTSDGTLTPGRALDEEVAQLVGSPLLGSAWWRERWNPHQIIYTGPAFSTDREAAMSLLDALAGRGWSWEMTHYHGSVSPYEVSLWHDENGGEACGARPTLPLAICAAVISALSDGGGDQ